MVIPTFERCEACATAVGSALAQTLEPLEVIVCDDGSRDGTRERFEAWQRDDPRVRYLRAGPNGRPGPTRNAGVRAARGDQIAFLDDDDRWHPDKLATQAPHLAADALVATNARRTSVGLPYFPDLHAPRTVERAEVMRDNPVITSTAVAPRAAILAAGGFPEQRWVAGVEDYGLWLRLAARGLRVLILPDMTADYSDHEAVRLSTAPLRQEAVGARLAWLMWAQSPRDRLALAAAAGHTRAVAVVAKDAAASAVKRRAGR